uniref:Uncharacterized protein n=1 Tax=Manihot esculenta TaxID=3983 RepID=A0A2C9VMJ2_MANES
MFVYNEQILNPCVPMALRLSGILISFFTIYFGLKQDLWGQGLNKWQKKRHVTRTMNHEETMIPGISCLIEVVNLMDLPPLFLIDDLCAYEYREIYYPAPLLELWMRSAQPPISLLFYERQLNKFIFSVCTKRTSIALHSEPSRANWICKSLQFNHLVNLFCVGSPSLDISVEKQWATIVSDEIPLEILVGELRHNLMESWLEGK